MHISCHSFTVVIKIQKSFLNVILFVGYKA